VPPFDIIAVNSTWTALCGFQPEEALHKTPKQLLQGEHTDASKARAFASALVENKHAKVMLINWTKGCRPFVHKLESWLIEDPHSKEKFYVTESSEEHNVRIVRALRRRASHFHSLRNQDLAFALLALIAATLLAWRSFECLKWFTGLPSGDVPLGMMVMMHEL